MLGPALALELAPGGYQLHAAPRRCSGLELCIPASLLGAASFEFQGLDARCPLGSLCCCRFGSSDTFWLLSDSSVCNKACGERVRSCFLWDRLRCSGHLCAVEPCHVRTAGPLLLDTAAASAPLGLLPSRALGFLRRAATVLPPLFSLCCPSSASAKRQLGRMRAAEPPTPRPCSGCWPEVSPGAASPGAWGELLGRRRGCGGDSAKEEEQCL